MKSFPGGPDSFRALVEAAPDPVLTVGPSGTVAYANPAAERLFGVPRTELAGHPLVHLLPAPLPERDPDPSGPGVEVPARTRHGRELRVEVRAAVHEHAGERYRILTLRDVTRRSRAERRLRTEHAATRALAEAGTWAQAAPRVLRALGEGLECSAALFWQMEPDAPVLCHGGDWRAAGARVERFLGMSRRLVFLEGMGLPGRAWQEGAPLWVPALAEEPGFTRAAAAEEGGLCAAYVLPVPLGSETLGVVELYFPRAQEPDAGAREMLAAVASAVGRHVQRERGEAALAQSEERFRTLIEYASDVVTVLDARGRIRFESPSVERVLGYAPRELLGRDAFDLVHPDDAPRTREALALAIRTPGVAINLEYRFRHRDGSWRTLESVGRNLLQAPTVRGVVVNSRDVSARRRAEDEVRRLSLTDELTGLYNRRGLLALAEQMLRTARRTGQGLLLLYADVDHLKRINDRFGHAEGDRLLVQAARFLSTVFRESDVVARVGGDEYVVLAPDLSREDGRTLVGRLRERLREWNEARVGRAHLSLSLGMAWYDPDRLCTVEALLKEADGAMYAEKRRR